MASRTITTYTDDLDGSTEDVRTVRFSVDSAHYEIDLSEAHAEELVEALKKYTAAGRRISAPQATSARRTSGVAPASRDYDPKAVRTWATSQGIEVPARGRVPLTVIQAYRQAHGANA